MQEQRFPRPFSDRHWNVLTNRVPVVLNIASVILNWAPVILNFIQDRLQQR